MHVNVYVDDDDVISELSDHDIKTEYERRFKEEKSEKIDIPTSEKIMQLRLAAIELRKCGKLANAVWLEDLAASVEQPR